jgi:type I restriction enzyme S subunit
MKTLLKTRAELQAAGRWDIDFHLPPEGIRQFPAMLLKRVDDVAALAKDKRDPTREPESVFQYIDISSIDVTVGEVANPQDVEGSDAPSRARKVVRAFDVVVSTCRPTRGAIAVVPPQLHNQIASTGFSIVRCRDGVNPFYLHYALRLASTLEQFRKWSTGSSYPAILDEDVAKTLIPIPSPEEQDRIAQLVVAALHAREQRTRSADAEWRRTLGTITAELSGQPVLDGYGDAAESVELPRTIAAIHEMLIALPPLSSDRNGSGAQATLPDAVDNHSEEARTQAQAAQQQHAADGAARRR